MNTLSNALCLLNTVFYSKFALFISARRCPSLAVSARRCQIEAHTAFYTAFYTSRHVTAYSYTHSFIDFRLVPLIAGFH